ncbi:fimbrial protein [Samsonia erythrinae]|nr:fimbrial protein [Samsonia erythrinae]
MRRLFQLLTSIFLAVLGASNAFAFTCILPETGQNIGSGTANVYVSLTPAIGVGQNLVVDLSNSIRCKNDSTGGVDVDHLNLTSGSAYGGALISFNGSLYWAGSTYPFPLNSNTHTYNVTHTAYQGLPLRMYLTATGAAGGVVINSGELIAVLRMYKIATLNGGFPRNFTWNIYARNSVVVPTGGCDVSARNVTVRLPDYPSTISVPLTVRCAQNQNLSYYLTGTLADGTNNIFSNTASSQPAQGVGVQLSNRNGIIAANDAISLGTVGTSSVDLGLTASYGRTGGQVTAGDVQSIIGVTFVYQ